MSYIIILFNVLTEHICNDGHVPVIILDTVRNQSLQLRHVDTKVCWLMDMLLDHCIYILFRILYQVINNTNSRFMLHFIGVFSQFQPPFKSSFVAFLDRKFLCCFLPANLPSHLCFIQEGRVLLDGLMTGWTGAFVVYVACNTKMHIILVKRS